MKLVINFMYLLVGMGLLAMCYYLMKEEVVLKASHVLWAVSIVVWGTGPYHYGAGAGSTWGSRATAFYNFVGDDVGIGIFNR